MDLEDFRRKLLRLESELEDIAAVGDAAAAVVELDQTRTGRLSRMDAIRAQSMSLDAANRRRQRLDQVRAALARIDAGSYGDCQDCGEPINHKRLAFDPAAVRCITCAQSAE